VIRYTIEKDIGEQIINPDVISFLLGSDITDIKVSSADGSISFKHPSGSSIIMNRHEYKDYIIQLLSEFHKTKFKLSYENKTYKFSYKIKSGFKVKGKAESTVELLKILQQIVQDLEIYPTK